MTIDQYVTVRDSSGKQRTATLRELLFLRGADMAKLLKTLGFEADFSDPVYEETLSSLLRCVPDNMDKREGSVIYDALAPAALALTELKLELEANRALSYASQSSGRWLELRLMEHGIARQEAASALRVGRFYGDEEMTQPYDVDEGIFSLPDNEINFSVGEKRGPGEYELTCLTLGEVGNVEQGVELTPVQYVNGLAHGVLGEILRPGEEEESDESMFIRFVKTVTSPAFGGNRPDYEKYFLAIDGIGSVRLKRAYPSSGQVTAIVLGSDYLPPSTELVEKIQAAVDPEPGKGVGHAPMAHRVTVQGADPVYIQIWAEVALADGVALVDVQGAAEEKVGEYLLQLRREWADYESASASDYVPTVVRISRTEAALLETPGIKDARVLIGGLDKNQTLEDGVPILGQLALEIMS